MAKQKPALLRMQCKKHKVGGLLRHGIFWPIVEPIRLYPAPRQEQPERNSTWQFQQAVPIRFPRGASGCATVLANDVHGLNGLQIRRCAFVRMLPSACGCPG